MKKKLLCIFVMVENEENEEFELRRVMLIRGEG